MNINNCWVAEYSHSQDKFHCDYLKVSINTNIQSIKDNKPSDWIIIGIFKTLDEAQEFIEEFKKQLRS